MSTRKTIRFYDSPRDTKVLQALSEYQNYGFANENSMVVAALYEFIEQHSSSSTYSPEELADLIVAKLKCALPITISTEVSEPENTSASTIELDTTATADDNTFAMATNFIDNLF